MNVMMQLRELMPQIMPERLITYPYRRITLDTLVSDEDFLLAADCSSDDISVQFPFATTGGRLLAIVKEDSSGHSVTVECSGLDQIEGEAEIALSSQWSKALLLSDGGNHWIRVV
jgi:hypothetical protein